MSSPPTFLDDPRLARLFGRQPIRPDATGVAMPDPTSLGLQTQSDSLDTAQDAAKRALIAKLDASGGGMAGKGNLTLGDIMAMSTSEPGMGMEADPDAASMLRIGGQQRDTRSKLADALKRRARFGKGAIP